MIFKKLTANLPLWVIVICSFGMLIEQLQAQSKASLSVAGNQSYTASSDSVDNINIDLKEWGSDFRALDRLMPDDPMELYVRSFMMESTNQNSFHIRPAHFRRNIETSEKHPWMNHPFNNVNSQANHSFKYFVFSPKIFRSINTELPMGSNDGALWQGRGENYSFSTGVGAEYGPVEVVFRPVFTHSENREFDLSPFPSPRGLSPYAMAFTNSDIPQRFGDESVSNFDLGDSFIKANYKGFAAGFSNQRIWIGPAVYNPLLLSYNAPGFKHAFLKTNRPFRFRYGTVEAKWFWGGLKESDFFDENNLNDLRFVSGIVLNYSPSFVPGFHIGYSRVGYSYYPDGGLRVQDLLIALRPSQPDNVKDPDEVFQTMMSLFARWTFPGSGFEIYAEWGRNDNRRRFRDILAEPELNRGYVLGFIKSFDLTESRKLLLNGEFTNVENSTVSSRQRDFDTWYSHDVIRQGFTNQGQVLGASIGPGSSTQILRLSYYEKRGMLGVSGQRVAMFNDRFHRHRETFRNLHPWPEFWFMIDRHEVQMNYGFHGLFFMPYGFEVQLDYHIGKFENRHNRWRRDVQNNQFMVTLRYNLWNSVFEK